MKLTNANRAKQARSLARIALGLSQQGRVAKDAEEAFETAQERFMERLVVSVVRWMGARGGMERTTACCPLPLTASDLSSLHHTQNGEDYNDLLVEAQGGGGKVPIVQEPSEEAAAHLQLVSVGRVPWG